MVFPDWAPRSLVDLIGRYGVFLLNENSETHPNYPHVERNLGMLKRLCTRPEMKAVWTDIFERSDLIIFAADEMLLANGGLVGSVLRSLRNFDKEPLLTAKQYESELTEIARLARQLARKLRKFDDKDQGLSFLPSHEMLSEEQLDKAIQVLDPNVLKSKKILINQQQTAAYVVASFLPSIDSSLTRLAELAKREALSKACRLRKLPRKVGDKNVLRTYFINVIRDYFISHFAILSPATVATFCSVALDDAAIDSELVRKLCPLDEETRQFLSSYEAQRKRKIQ